MDSIVRMLRIAAAVTGVDLAVSVLWWGAQGLAAPEVLRRVAWWVLGADARPSLGTTLVGVAVLYAIYLGMTLGLAAVLRCATTLTSERRVARRWLPLGVGYGALAWCVVYQWWVPAWIHPLTLSRDPVWLAACMGLHAGGLGPAIAYGLLRPSASPAATVARSGRAGLAPLLLRDSRPAPSSPRPSP